MDCWRFYPDGMRSLAQFARLEAIDVTTQWEDEGYDDGSDWWHDTMLVCRKQDRGFLLNTKIDAVRWFQHRVMTMGMR
jgi:hypothetical protein